LPDSLNITIERDFKSMGVSIGRYRYSERGISI